MTLKQIMASTVALTIFLLTAASVNAQLKQKTYGEMVLSLAEQVNPVVAGMAKTNNFSLAEQIDPIVSALIESSTATPIKLGPTIASFLDQFTFPPMDAESIQSFTIMMLESALQSVAAANGTVSQTCIDHLNVTLEALPRQEWAIRMVDAIGKPQSGLLLGAIKWLGTYDECVNITATAYHGANQTDPYSPFKGQYCRVGIPLVLNAGDVPDIASQAMPIGDIVVGLCTPSTCTPQDVLNLVDGVLSFIPKKYTKNVTVQANAVVCQKDELEYGLRAIVVIVIFSALALLLIVGTAYDVFVIRKLHQATDPDPDFQSGIAITNDIPDPSSPGNNIRYRGRSSETTPLLGSGDKLKQPQDENDSSLCGRVLQAFSMYTNGMRILSTKKQAGTLGALNGIRFLSMAWVILGHTFAFAAFSGRNILPFITEKLQKFLFMAVANATVSVDTFFIISGLLVSFLCLKSIRLAGGIRKFQWVLFYFHRFWRLTPPYMLVLALYVPLMQYWSNGPMWSQTGIEHNYCEDSWWMNLLYINNFFPTKDTCMGWSWYLANDMQFYIISPLLLIPLYHSGVLGGVVSLLFLVASCTVSGVLSSVHNWPISVIGGGGDPTQIGSYFDDYYIKPYCRIGPYVVGMVTGYILYNCDCKYRMSRTRNILGWLIATACCVGVLFGPYDTISGKHVSPRNVIALYTAVNRSVWAVGVSWVIFACATGHGGIVNWFLSWKIFIPLSRLTYIAYLIHPVVIFTVYTSKRELFYLTDLEIIVYYIAFGVLSNVAAFVLSLAFESPFMGLEKIFLKRERKH